jgi:hypothetical protein
MARYTPHWVLAALIVAIVTPVTPQPVQNRRWDKTEGPVDLESRGV